MIEARESLESSVEGGFLLLRKVREEGPRRRKGKRDAVYPTEGALNGGADRP